METDKSSISGAPRGFRIDTASISASSDCLKIAFAAGKSSKPADSGDSKCCQQLTVATLARDSSCEDIVAQLPAGCGRVSWAQERKKEADDADRVQAVTRALAGRNIELSLDDARTLQLRGLAHCWLSANQAIPTANLWHDSLPPCNQQVTHLPSWQRINDRLASRMLRGEAATDRDDRRRLLSAIVAELGAHELSLHRIDSDLSVTPLVREKFLGYGNLLGMARLSTVAVPCGDVGGDLSQQLQRLLDLAAKGSTTKLDLTIGDLLPAESAYGHYDVNVAVFTLGKLHDSKTLDELQPSPGDVAASLTYAFIKSFFDTIVHCASAHGISRVAVVGEFFQPESCRSRLLEAWNFTGVSKEAIKLQFLRQDCSDLLSLAGGLL